MARLHKLALSDLSQDQMLDAQEAGMTLRERSRERMRRYRARMRNGSFVVSVEVDKGFVDRLVEAGLLADSKAEDHGAIAKAIRTVESFLPSQSHDR